MTREGGQKKSDTFADVIFECPFAFSPLPFSSGITEDGERKTEPLANALHAPWALIARLRHLLI